MDDRLNLRFKSKSPEAVCSIFAMISSRGEFVVKLPRNRVGELVKSGKGEHFDPGHGRLMKEWLVVKAPGLNWTALAKEACEFVKQSRR